MTVKEVAQRTGLSHQAIYKRLKAKGVTLAAIKDAKTGHFTPDGERLIIELFNLDAAPEQAENRPEKTNRAKNADKKASSVTPNDR